MGILYSKPAESQVMVGPPLRTPLTEIGGAFNLYDGTECEAMELRFLDCSEAYGPLKGKEKCKFLYQDFLECAGKWKQLERIHLMRKERQKQYWKGAFGMGPKKDRWMEEVPKGTYAPDPWEHKGPFN